MGSVTPTGSTPHAEVLSDRYSPRFTRMFSHYVRRMFRKNFHGVRIEPDSVSILRALNSHNGPAIVIGNHPGWWDPLVAVLLTSLYTPDRPMLVAMDAHELRRFSILRRLGVFGIDPDDTASLPLLVDYLAARFEQRPRATFWITPQGRFTDVREPIRLRPGAAAVAAKLHPAPTVVALAMDYCFWNDRRPELCLRVRRVEAEPSPGRQPTTTDWMRAMQAGMQGNQDSLTERALRRNSDDWLHALPPSRHQKTNPVYDLWLKLRGRSGELRTHRDRTDGP